MSKVIKASKVTGEYKVEKNLQTLSFNKKNSDDGSESGSKKKSKDGKFKSRKKKIINEAENKAEKIISDAENKAEEIIQNAREEKEEIINNKEEIYQDIKDEAREEGLKAAESEVDEVKKEFRDLIINFENELQEEKSKIRKDIINLAVKISSLVIDVKLETEHELINNIIEDMLSKIDDNHRDIVVRVNPDLIPYIEENRFYQHINQKNLEFISDPELKKGDCVVETNLGGKEGSIEHKLDLIKKELLKEVEQHD